LKNYQFISLPMHTDIAS